MTPQERTPETRAQLALGPWAERPVESTPATRANLEINVAEAIRSAEQDAAEKEREACAQSADDVRQQGLSSEGWRVACRTVAAAIRARSLR